MAPPRSLRSAAVLTWTIWLLCGAYTSQFIDRGWVPHDEGTIGQSAERVLAGQLPHRDFDDTYTGGLTYLNAAGMRLFGMNLRSPRYVLFAVFMAFLAAVYGIVRRIAPRPVALGAMALVTAWSVPNYFVSLPSWYNLFLATFGVLAFMRFLESRGRAWIFVAGLCGGLSVLMKISGLYYLAGGLLFLAYIESSAAVVPTVPPLRSRFWLIAAIPTALFVAVQIQLLRSGVVTPDLLPIFLPVTLVSALFVWSEWRIGTGAVAIRLHRLSSVVWPFVAGAVVPVGAFVLFYVWHHAVVDLLRGVFILPHRRLAEAAASPPSVATLSLAVPCLALLLAGRRRLPREGLIAAVGGVFLAVLLALGSHPVVYSATWAVVRALPLVAVLAAIRVLSPSSDGLAPNGPSRPQVFLVVTMAAMVALVQFPYAAGIYFCYAAPMTFIALIALIRTRPNAPHTLQICAAAFLLMFAVAFMNRAYVWALGRRFVPYVADDRLDIPRGGLSVRPEEKRVYEELVRVLGEHVHEGTIYAGPDCPEVYFLSGFPNPTRAIFDFLTPSPLDRQRMAELLSRAPVHAAVINTAPLFSPALDADAMALLQRRFPSNVQVGQFTVMFEETSGVALGQPQRDVSVHPVPVQSREGLRKTADGTSSWPKRAIGRRAGAAD